MLLTFHNSLNTGVASTVRISVEPVDEPKAFEGLFTVVFADMVYVAMPSAKSANEELQTVNSELQTRVDAFGRANDEMENLLNSNDIATLC